jgi:peptidoglycan L-alanyl-D-glutamate endopeptidase CwlK
MSLVKTFEKCRGDLAFKVARVLVAMDALGHPVKVVESYRPQERQDALYAQGRTETGPRVTWTQKSRHTEGRAVDLAFEGPHPYSNEHPWHLLKVVAEAIGLEGLGEKDRGHWQV